MRKILLLTISFYVLSLSGHEVNVHEYIVNEAFRILSQRYLEAGGSNDDINEFKKYLSYKDVTPRPINGVDQMFVRWDVVAGSIAEDSYDMVYGNYTWNLGFTEVNVWPATLTHFWKADDGIDQTNPFYAHPTNENAWKKTRKFLFDGGAVFAYYPSISNLAVVNYGMTNTSLINLFNNQTIYCEYSERTKSSSSYKMSGNDGKYFAMYLLGHVAHLLGDMSVPAHVHGDSHPNSAALKNLAGEAAGNEDPYEIWMQNNAISTFIDNDGDDGFMPFIVNMSDYDAVYFLFYTMNQMSDHFGSKDNDGNNSLIQGENDFLVQKYSAWGPADLKNTSDIMSTANKTFNFCIGTTASLFYWFGIRTGILKSKINRLNYSKKVNNPTFMIKSTGSITLSSGFSYTSQNSNSSFKAEVIGDNALNFQPGNPVGICIQCMSHVYKSAVVDKFNDDLMTDINVSNLENSYQVFPNPSSGEFNILMKNKIVKEVIVYNSYGQKVKIITDKDGFDGNYKISMPNVPIGIYFISLVSNDEKVLHKIIIE
jgi:hypothetical protein